MFQEGLHQVFFKARPLPHPVPADDSTAGELMEDRLVRWFGTVVNTRLLLSGVTKSSLTVIDTQQFNEYILYAHRSASPSVFGLTRVRIVT